MAIVSFKKRNYSKEDVLDVFKPVYSYLPSSHKGLIDGLKTVFGLLNGGKVTNKSLYTIIRDWKEQANGGRCKDVDSLYRCLVECFVLLINAKLQKELNEYERSASKLLRKAETQLNKAVEQITYAIFSQLSHSVGVKIVRSNKASYSLELEVGVANAPELSMAGIEPYVKNMARITIGDIFYTPEQKERKGFFSSLLHFIPDQFHYSEKQAEYKREIKVWLEKILEELSNDQKLIGRSVVIYSFLSEYCSVARHAKNKTIRESRGWHTLTCRWVAFVASVVVAVGYFFVAYGAEVVRKSEEMHKPRYPYLPPETAEALHIPVSVVENQWIYDALEIVALAIGGIILLEFIVAELRIFRPTFKVWRTYASQRLTSYNYLLNFHPNATVKYSSLLARLLGSVVCGTYWFCPQLFLHEKTFTRAEVFDSLVCKTPSEGALFYVENRRNVEFLDSMYEATVIPAIESCDYLELKKVQGVLKNTKYNKIISGLMAAKRSRCLENIKAEIAKNEKLEIAAVNKYIVPTLSLEMDSLVENNVDEILNSYSGGILNYRKLAFLVGRDSSKFVSIFDEKVDVAGFGKCSSDYANNFLYIISYQQDKYCNSLTGKSFHYKAAFKQPVPVVNLSQNTIGFIQTYTDKENVGVIYSAVKDYAVPIAIGFVSGGASLVYDAATMGYDIVQSIRNTELSQEDIAKFLCEQDVVDHTINIYVESVRKQLIQHIKNSNKLLYNKIEKEL